MIPITIEIHGSFPDAEDASFMEKLKEKLRTHFCTDMLVAMTISTFECRPSCLIDYNQLRRFIRLVTVKPTEVMAEQEHETLCRVLSQMADLQIVFLADFWPRSNPEPDPS